MLRKWRCALIWTFPNRGRRSMARIAELQAIWLFCSSPAFNLGRYARPIASRQPCAHAKYKDLRSFTSKWLPLNRIGRPRLGAPLQPAPPHGLRPPTRRAEAVPPVGLSNARPPRVRAHGGRRGDHGAAGAGLHERRGHGHRRAAARHGREAPRRARRGRAGSADPSAP